MQKLCNVFTAIESVKAIRLTIFYSLIPVPCSLFPTPYSLFFLPVHQYLVVSVVGALHHRRAEFDRDVLVGQ